MIETPDSATFRFSMFVGIHAFNHFCRATRFYYLNILIPFTFTLTDFNLISNLSNIFVSQIDIPKHGNSYQILRIEISPPQNRRHNIKRPAWSLTELQELRTPKFFSINLLTYKPVMWLIALLAVSTLILIILECYTTIFIGIILSIVAILA